MHPCRVNYHSKPIARTIFRLRDTRWQPSSANTRRHAAARSQEAHRPAAARAKAVWIVFALRRGVLKATPRAEDRRRHTGWWVRCLGLRLWSGGRHRWGATTRSEQIGSGLGNVGSAQSRPPKVSRSCFVAFRFWVLKDPKSSKSKKQKRKQIESMNGRARSSEPNQAPGERQKAFSFQGSKSIVLDGVAGSRKLGLLFVPAQSI